MKLLSWEQIEDARVNDQITLRMFWGDNIMVTKWRMAPGTTLPMHDHVSEQVSIVQEGSVTMSFPDGETIRLRTGDMVVIPPSRPHGATVGPEGGVVIDIFSPIRNDLIAKWSGSFGQEPSGAGGPQQDASSDAAYRSLLGFLHGAGIAATLEQLKEVPLEVVARFAYERECLSMGQLRKVLGIDKDQAKALLREWKHGDDHSESSLRRKMERLVLLPGERTVPHRK